MSGIEQMLEVCSIKLLSPIALVALFLSVLYLYRRFQCLPAPIMKKKLPPSPPKLPIIGNLHQISLYPYRSLQSLSQKHGDVMLIKLGNLPILIISSAEAAREMMKTHDAIFSDRPYRDIFAKLLYNNKDISTAPYGEYWRKIRSAFVVHLASRTRVRSYSKIREEETALMMEKIRQSLSTEINLGEMFMNLTNDIICRIAFGKKYGATDRVVIKRIIDDLNDLLGGFYVGDFIPWLAWIDRLQGKEAKADRASKHFDQLFEDIVQQHLNRQDQVADNEIETSTESKKTKDFVDVLLELQRDETADFPVDTLTIKAILLDTFVGGTDTTYTLLEWAMSELIKDPRVTIHLQEEIRGIVGDKQLIEPEDLDKMKYMRAVIKETLRLHPPIPLLVPRRTTQDVNLMGYDIPMGTEVITNAWAIHRDPRYWDQPEEFRPERFLDSDIELGGLSFQLIPFGSGRRGCPGISIALANDELVLANLIHKFNWSLPNGAKGDSLDMTEISSLVIHRKTPLIVVPLLPTSC